MKDIRTLNTDQKLSVYEMYNQLSKKSKTTTLEAVRTISALQNILNLPLNLREQLIVSVKRESNE